MNQGTEDEYDDVVADRRVSGDSSMLDMSLIEDFGEDEEKNNEEKASDKAELSQKGKGHYDRRLSKERLNVRRPRSLRELRATEHEVAVDQIFDNKGEFSMCCNEEGEVDGCILSSSGSHDCVKKMRNDSNELNFRCIMSDDKAKKCEYFRQGKLKST
mmetsp:Transcript_16175/g.19668  ORF Transcript_16175/g.19668 Transcript_16175/m.19668 type:complete len:158 (+) Transcript_16175:195-668(+)